ncbi:MAG: fumarate hydratase [Candidatus Omnitrophica bacterium]|nr:fumarate hydratase [Candidatus Omnitrophota bacterium]
MRKIGSDKISSAVAELSMEANFTLRRDILAALRRAWASEKAGKAKKVLGILVENAAIARRSKTAICQDTGMAEVFIDIGQRVAVTGGGLEDAVNEGIRRGYKKGYLRKSVVSDPLLRRNTNDNTPAVIHARIVPGDKIKITVMPKGFGSENKTRIRMFNPTQGASDIAGFVVEAVRKAAADACPPYIIGVGIGGTIDKACILAKEALLRPVNRRNRKAHIASLEKKLKKGLNALKIGPMGFGGGATCLAVNIESFPTHIAGLPVCVSISCHATRSATKTI